MRKATSPLAPIAMALLLVSIVQAQSASAVVSDPGSWSNEKLVAQLVFECAAQNNLQSLETDAKKGLGGIVLLGGTPPPNLKSAINHLAGLNAGGARPFFAADEEGGQVQRLTSSIYALPSAKKMGTWSAGKLRATAASYAKHMAALGVRVSLAPVADLAVAGKFIDNSGRAFSAVPNRVATDVKAWSQGLKSGGVLPVLKHWPGHGSANDSHIGVASTPNISILQKRDLVPFKSAIRAGFRVVMVGHLLVPGLTEKATPASRSPKALSLLRSQIGPRGLILTDSLSMSAALLGEKSNLVNAAIDSLRAGADMVMACQGSKNLIRDLARAANDGRLTRADLIVKVGRVIAVKAVIGG